MRPERGKDGASRAPARLSCVTPSAASEARAPAEEGLMGLYQRPDSDVYWISYNGSDGLRVRESTRTTDKEAAKRLLKDREGRAARGEVLLPRVDRITYDEAKADLIAYYKTSGNRDLSEAEARLKHLDRFFSKRRLVIITPDVVTAYAADRQAHRKDEDDNVIPGAANGTINRELAAVRNMEQAGVPRSVAMKLTGHKTENVYRRYAIVSDADLDSAAQKLSAASASR
jgi:hypothetical protein